MRKRQIVTTLQSDEPSNEAWLDMNRNVLVEVTSEEKAYPIESAPSTKNIAPLLKPTEQTAYWNWRHSHPDHDNGR
jgi:hypothetical protein